MSNSRILISEVGPRDGLQSVQAVMPTADKLRWIDALYVAGVREIEVASLVPVRLLPHADQHERRTRRLDRHRGPPDALTEEFVQCVAHDRRAEIVVATQL